MGKSPDDLNLSPDPLSHTRKPATEAADIRDTDWFQFVREIDELIDSEQYIWAVSTIDGIRRTVQQTRRVTEGQRKAIANIRDARSRADGWRRRYEGYRR